MQNIIIDYMQQHYTQRKSYNRMMSILLILSLLVSIYVFWTLRQTGLTLAGDAACGIEEHFHTEECFEITTICDITDETHTHEETCYNQNIICNKDEHTHSIDCYSDETADAETQLDWQEMFSDFPYTDDVASNLIGIAETQIGYTESTRNFELDNNGNRHGYTRYGDWYGTPYHDWSALFVSFCLHYAGISEDAAPYFSGEEAMRIEYDNLGIYRIAADCIPIPGDIIFIDEQTDNTTDDVGIISSVNDYEYTVIQGDYNNTVVTNTYSADDTRILGFGSINKIIENMASDEEISEVDFVINYIDTLPNADTAEAILAEYEAADDMEGYIGYITEISDKIRNAYVMIEGLDEQAPLVTNTYKLDDLSWMYITTLATSGDSVTVHQINNSTNGTGLASTILVYGKAVSGVSNNLSGFKYWTAYVIEKSAAGYYVADIDSSSTSKASYEASSSGGFVLLTHSSWATWTADVGDWVEIDFTYTSAKTYSADGYGSVKVIDIDNSNALNIIQGADTDSMIEINMHNYGTSINDKWKSNNKYPGFQLPNPTKQVLSPLDYSDFNFGDAIVVDNERTSVMGKGGAINANGKDNNGTSGNAPVSGAMYPTLIDGYPALSDGTSLKYLFDSATQQNTTNVNYLFLYDEITGAYHYNSHENHAQYNSDTDTFTLYKQILTPNFMLYPFGNFLPYNDIVTQTTQVSLIDRYHFLRTALAAAEKADSTGNSDYDTLSILDNFVTLMDAKKSGWTGEYAIQTYFDIRGIPTAPGEYNVPKNMFSIDYDEPKDFFFGMDMHMDFIQPKDGYTGLDGNQPMKYHFNGDDDVWIYIDDVLFLDLSGIHRHVGGEIDFVNGIVTYYTFNIDTGEADNVYKTLTFAEILGSNEGLNNTGTFENYSHHTFDFYYMERGSGSSVCQMSFNFPVLHKNSISVTKELTLSDENVEQLLGDPNYTFQILDVENGVPTKNPFIGEGVEYTIYDTYGNAIGTNVTGPNGIFTLKANQRATFAGIEEDEGQYYVRELLDYDIFAQYGKVTVDGVTTTIDYYDDTVVGTDTFAGIESSIKDISDGSTYFKFSNHLDITKTSTLSLYKAFGIQAVTYALTPQEIGIYITIDDELLPIDTKYTIVDADGTETNKTVTEPGLITFYSDQHVFLEKLIAGSVIKIKEHADSAEGYIVNYISPDMTIMVTNDEDDLTVGTGNVPLDTNIPITISNARPGIEVMIPVTKELQYSNGNTYTFDFELIEITSATDITPIENGIYLTNSIEIQNESDFMYFILQYIMNTEPGSYYYLIQETSSHEHITGSPLYYIIEITISEGNYAPTAEITNIWDNNGLAHEDVTFVNSIVHDLTVSKTLTNSSDTVTEFTFHLTASKDNMPITGTYACIGSERYPSITFDENGTATILLHHNESITIQSLPYGTTWTVTEEHSEGYMTKYIVNSGDVISSKTASGNLITDTSVDFQNTKSMILPITGGIGTHIITFSGTLLIAISLICGLILLVKPKKEVKK